jgi:MFS family permease
MLSMPVLGIGHLLVMSGGQTLTGNRSQDRDYERNFGLLTFYASMGHALGPFAAGFVADRGGLEVDVDSAFILATGLFLVAALVAIPVVERRVKGEAKPQHSVRGSAREVFGLPGFKSAILVSGSITAVIDVMLVFLPLLGRELGLSASQVGILLAIRAASAMAVRIILGPLSRRLGMRWTLGLGSGLTVLGTLAIALTTDFWLLGALMLLLGFSTGIGQPVTMAWVTRISPKDVRGLAISIRLTSNRLGQVVIPAVAGVLAATSAGTVFLLLAGLQGLSFIVSERALGKKPPADE